MTRAVSENGRSAGRARILLLTPFVQYEFFAPMKQGALDAAEALAVEVTFTGTPDGDVTALAAQAEAALGSDFHGIGINMIQAGAFDRVAANARDLGIPLISFNVDDARPENTRLATVGQNMRSAGRRFGDAVAPLVSPGDHALMLMHDPGITALEDRAAGAKERLQHLGIRWTSLITGTDREVATRRVTAALHADPSIRIVLGTGEADTQAAGLAVEASFDAGRYIVAGFDTGGEIRRLLKAGVIRLTVDQQPYVQGYLAVVNLALAHQRGSRPSTIDTGANILRTDEVQ